MQRRLSRPLLQTATVIASLALGAVFHSWIFGLSYFGSDVVWLLVAAKALSSFLVGLVFGNFVARPAFGMLLAYLCLETGPILMAAWGLFNYYETGDVGFNFWPWLLPVVIDLAAGALGYTIGVRRS